MKRLSRRVLSVLILGLPLGLLIAAAAQVQIYSSERKALIMTDKVEKTEAEWKKQLTPMQFDVTRKAGTERAFSGEYWNSHDKGMYKCVACGADLFDSATKFESGTGWPSFYQPVNKANVEDKEDFSHGMVRMEARCHRCHSHLGHVFEDGPKPTGLRYCINSAALKFEKK